MGPLSLFWSILTAHVEGVVTRVYKLAPVTYVNLPWTNILPMGIEEEGGGEVLHATETALSSTRLSLGAYASPGAPLPTQ